MSKDWTPYYFCAKKFGNQEETANEERKNMWAEKQVKKRVDEKCLSSDYLCFLSELAKSWANLECRKGNVTD